VRVEYESEGLHTPGGKYLPDLTVWYNGLTEPQLFECKPNLRQLTQHDLDRYLHVPQLILLDGPPEPQLYWSARMVRDYLDGNPDPSFPHMDDRERGGIALWSEQERPWHENCRADFFDQQQTTQPLNVLLKIAGACESAKSYRFEEHHV
jgi:hypothetical protein